MKQLDIFGNEIDIEMINAEKQRVGRLSIKDTFRKIHGYNKNNYCKDCIHFICFDGRKRNYYKCKKIGLTNSEATDIRLKDYACDLFERKETP